jgi:predicted dehydrogenase
MNPEGTNDVDDMVTGFIRTSGSSISFNGAWAQNIGKGEAFIDFMGDKGGARLDYGRKFTFWSGDTLESFEPEYDIPNMYLCEDEAFFESCTTGVKNRSHIDNILDSMLLLDTLYQSADRGEEIRL